MIEILQETIDLLENIKERFVKQSATWAELDNHITKLRECRQGLIDAQK